MRPDSQTKKKRSSTKINFVIDLSIFIAFLLAMDPRLTGLAIHEWLSIAFGTAVFVHLLLHWKWIVATTRRAFGKIAAQARINYILNTLLFIAMTILIFTGLMISEVALPGLAIQLQPNAAWRFLHSFSADAVLIIVGLHVALHWKWIVNAFRRYIVRPVLPTRMKMKQEEVHT